MVDKAYDYKAQRWVTGDDATTLLEAQMMDEIELLAGDEGDNFAMMIGVNRKDQLAKTIRCLRESLAKRLGKVRAAKEAQCWCEWGHVAENPDCPAGLAEMVHECHWVEWTPGLARCDCGDTKRIAWPTEETL